MKYLVIPSVLLFMAASSVWADGYREEPITLDKIKQSVDRYKDARFCIVTSSTEKDTKVFADNVYYQQLSLNCDGANESIYGSTTKKDYLDAKSLLTATAGEFVEIGFLATQCEESRCVLQRQDTAFAELFEKWKTVSNELAKISTILGR